MKCLLCHKEEDKLAKSHIFPQGFFTMLEKKGQLKTIKENGENGRKLNVAIYDAEILCQSCEHKIMEPLDTYGIRIIRDKKESFEITVPNTDSKILIFENIDKSKLRGFIASLLWRVSISNQKELQDLSIGCIYEERIRLDLINNGKFEYIDFVLQYFTDPRHAAFFTPYYQKLLPKDTIRDTQSINGWILNIPFIKMNISLDKRPHPSRAFYDLQSEITGKPTNILASTSLHPEESNQYNLMAFETSQDEKTLRELSGVLIKYEYK